MKPVTDGRYDLIIAGGGLAGGLLAWRLAMLRPELSWVMLERGETIGGSHTWSFHSSDVSAAAREWLRPLITRSWDYYDVRFPHMERRLSGGYHSIRSEDFHARLGPVLGERVRYQAVVENVSGDQAWLTGGQVLRAGAVIDARGFPPSAIAAKPDESPATAGYQVFFGQDLRLDAPHGLDGPLLMDATCEQRGGFRFFYLLPWTADTLLVEDTRYTDRRAVDADECRAEIAAYAARRGWRIEAVLREEIAALPIPLVRTPAAPIGAVAIGTGAGFFHTTTGYSLPDAVRVVECLTAVDRPTLPALRAAIAGFVAQHERRQRYFRFLNRMLFRGAAPAQRYRLLQRFYKMPAGTVGRFYAGSLTILDRARVLCGKPPIPLRAAFGCLWPGGRKGTAHQPQEEMA